MSAHSIVSTTNLRKVSSIIVVAMPGRKILLIDDSPVVRDVTRAILEQAGYVVMEQPSPFGLLSAINDARPDLVLLDVNMPALSGDAAVRINLRNGILTQQRRRCPIVLFSSLPEAELADLTAQCGATGYICKTTHPTELLVGVKRYLGPR